jgi:hypothetical protein
MWVKMIVILLRDPFLFIPKESKFLIGHRAIHPAYKWLWQPYCQKQKKILLLACSEGYA